MHEIHYHSNSDWLTVSQLPRRSTVLYPQLVTQCRHFSANCYCTMRWQVIEVTKDDEQYGNNHSWYVTVSFLFGISHCHIVPSQRKGRLLTISQAIQTLPTYNNAYNKVMVHPPPWLASWLPNMTPVDIEVKLKYWTHSSPQRSSTGPAIRQPWSNL